MVRLRRALSEIGGRVTLLGASPCWLWPGDSEVGEGAGLMGGRAGPGSGGAGAGPRTADLLEGMEGNFGLRPGSECAAPASEAPGPVSRLL